MIPLVINVIDRAFGTNRCSARFFQHLILGLCGVGVLLGLLAYFVSIYISVLEILIVSPLIWAIKGLSSINRDNINLLDGANRVLKGAQGQKQIEHRIRSEIRLEKQKGGKEK